MNFLANPIFLLKMLAWPWVQMTMTLTHNNFSALAPNANWICVFHTQISKPNFYLDPTHFGCPLGWGGREYSSCGSQRAALWQGQWLQQFHNIKGYRLARTWLTFLISWHNYSLFYIVTSLVVQMVKRLPTMWVTWVEKISWRRRWQPTPVFLPGKSHGRRSLVGYRSWGRKELDMMSNFTFTFFHFILFISVSLFASKIKLLWNCLSSLFFCPKYTTILIFYMNLKAIHGTLMLCIYWLVIIWNDYEIYFKTRT